MSQAMWFNVGKAFVETLYMVFVSGGLATVLGLPLGVLLYVTQKTKLSKSPWVNRIVGGFVNILRAIPFIILMVAIIPLTRFIVGSSIGTTAAIVPLAVAATPFFARLVEGALQALPEGLLEAGVAMGGTPLQITCRMLLPEALCGIIHGVTIMLITLVGYSAMAGAIGGGGLGDLAINYGYQRFDATVMALTVVILLCLVQGLQWLGDKTVMMLQQRGCA